MKVICIHGTNAGDPSCTTNRPAQKDDEIYEGEIYTVVGLHKIPEGDAYFLAEKRKDCCYGVVCFIPLSDKSEKETIKIKNNTESI